MSVHVELFYFDGHSRDNAFAAMPPGSDSNWTQPPMPIPTHRDASGRITTSQSRVAGWVLPTNEELMIARHTATLLDIG